MSAQAAARRKLRGGAVLLAFGGVNVAAPWFANAVSLGLSLAGYRYGDLRL